VGKPLMLALLALLASGALFRGGTTEQPSSTGAQPTPNPGAGGLLAGLGGLLAKPAGRVRQCGKFLGRPRSTETNELPAAPYVFGEVRAATVTLPTRITLSPRRGPLRSDVSLNSAVMLSTSGHRARISESLALLSNLCQDLRYSFSPLTD
jgi:hypothetical protein